MSKHKKRHYKFKKHEMSEPEKITSMEALLNLYEESQTLDAQDKTIKNSETAESELSLKKIIEQKRKTKRNQKIFFGIFLTIVLLAAMVAGFIFFDNNKKFDLDAVELSVKAPEELVMGEKFEYEIIYKNVGGVSLENARVFIQPPKGLLIEKTEPESLDRNWQIGNISPQATDSIKIIGKIIDDLDDTQRLKAKLTFKPKTFNAEFSKTVSFNSFLKEPEISFDTSLPGTVGLGQKLDIVINLENNAETNFEKIKLVFDYPDDFEIEKVEPEAYEDDNTWLFTELLADEEKHKISVSGFFPADLEFSEDSDRDRTLKVSAYLPDQADNYYLIKQEKFPLKIIDQAVSVHLIANGSTENKNITLGEDLNITLIAKNNGEQDFSNVSLSVLVDSSPLDIIDWDNIEDENYGKIQKTDAGKEITWNQTQIPDLAKLSTDEEVEIELKLPTKSMNDFNDKDLESLRPLQLHLFGVLDFDPEENQMPRVESSPIEIKLKTNLNLTAKAYYHDVEGNVLGEGPLPPEVGKTTKIYIAWDLTNSLHEARNISVSATLNNAVVWSNETDISVGELNYNEEKNTVTWKINRLPIIINQASAIFAIEFTPTNDDLNKFIKFTSTTTATALDKKTADQLIITKNILSSALEHDKYAEGKGMVILPEEE